MELDEKYCRLIVTSQLIEIILNNLKPYAPASQGICVHGLVSAPDFSELKDLCNR